MKKKFKTLVVILLSVTLFASCELTPEDIAKSVRHAIESQMEEKGIDNTEIKTISLEKVNDSLYNGKIETFTEGVTSVAPIKVVYTDTQVRWEIATDETVETINMDELSDEMAVNFVHDQLCAMISEDGTPFDQSFILNRTDKTHFEGTIKIFDINGNETSHQLNAIYDGESIEYEILEAL